jgi:hypothetical protein
MQASDRVQARRTAHPAALSSAKMFLQDADYIYALRMVRYLFLHK